ncbi:hypothetical protein [Kitasatospora sp. NPDC094015]|uniref:hypothetical protein n=1 Tax=Kitasatospora sp. NPDC094015 TaxID=3155205 RepID=UPI0033290EA7
MTWAISRDDRLAQLRQRLTELGATQNTLVPGTPAHAGLQHEIDAVWTEIQELQNAHSLNPKVLLITVLAITLLLVRMLA